MDVIFVLTATGEEILEMVSTDVAGLLAAVKRRKRIISTRNISI